MPKTQTLLALTLITSLLLLAPGSGPVEGGVDPHIDPGVEDRSTSPSGSELAGTCEMGSAQTAFPTHTSLGPAPCVQGQACVAYPDCGNDGLCRFGRCVCLSE